MNTIKDRDLWTINGFAVLLIPLAVVLYTFYLLSSDSNFSVIGVALLFPFILCVSGFFINHPNEARVVTLFGKYIGTASEPGFYFTVPFTLKDRVSLKVVNINTEKMKVNDAKGNPIEIGAVVVWRVRSPYEAYFGVDNYQHFVSTQADSAIRTLASSYPYDSQNEATQSLRGNPEVISQALEAKLQERLEVAGVEVIETRLSHLAYAPEIAQAMLKRQQAEAIIMARKYIVENAVAMVEDVLEHFDREKTVSMTDPEKVTLINNLLVALVSDQDAQPVINMGS